MTKKEIVIARDSTGVEKRLHELMMQIYKYKIGYKDTWCWLFKTKTACRLHDMDIKTLKHLTRLIYKHYSTTSWRVEKIDGLWVSEIQGSLVRSRQRFLLTLNDEKE